LSILFYQKATVFALSPDVFSGLCRPVLAGSRYSINNFHKISVKAYVYHLAESIIPDAGVLFQTAGIVRIVCFVDFAPAGNFYTL
jgi:hypothetical protein